MKNVGIITLSGNFNYGNRLQNYAMQKTIEKLGCRCVTFWNTIGHEVSKKQKIKNNIKGKLTFIPRYELEKRRINFEHFTNKYIKNHKYIIHNEDVDQRKVSNIDYFVIGSDQVWNYTFSDFSKVAFAMFSNKDKNISYAASFGISDIPEDKKDFYKEGLKNVGAISVREDRGAELVKDLTKKNAKVVLDPTLLLSRNDYIKIERKPKKMTKKPYILMSFLGQISSERRKEIKKLAKRKKLDIIDLSDQSHKNYYNSGPREYLYLFHHASIIFTDSFHSCVFSFIFQKPFYVFDRIDPWMQSMNSRLDTFLGKFKMSDRKIESLKKVRNVMQVDYENAYEILDEERKKSLDFLSTALHV